MMYTSVRLWTRQKDKSTFLDIVCACATEMEETLQYLFVKKWGTHMSKANDLRRENAGWYSKRSPHATEDEALKQHGVFAGRVLAPVLAIAARGEKSAGICQ